MDFFNATVLQSRKYTATNPRSYIATSNQEALVLRSLLPETRVTYINSLGQYTTAASSNNFVISRNSNVLVKINEPSNNNARLEVLGTVTASNVTLTNRSNKQIVLDDYGNNATQFAGFGYTGGTLYYQTPNIMSKHVFQSGDTGTLSKELMRIQYSGTQAQVGINLGTPSDLDASTSLKVMGKTQIIGDLFVTGAFASSCNYLKGDQPIAASLLPNNLVYLTTSNKIDESLLSTKFNFQYLRSQKNVGIGTSKPLQKLHVQGSLAVSDRIGIGTAVLSSPLSRIHAVEDAASITTARLENNVSGKILEAYASGVPILVVHGNQVGVSIGSSNIAMNTALHITGNATITGGLSVGSFTVQNPTMNNLRVVDQATSEPLLVIEGFVNSQQISVRALNTYIPFIARSNIATSEIQTYNSSNITMIGNVIVTRKLEVGTQVCTAADNTLMQTVFPLSSALNKVLLLNGYLRTWQDGSVNVGLSAQELQTVLPQAVDTMADGKLGIHYDAVIALLIQAVKDLANR